MRAKKTMLLCVALAALFLAVGVAEAGQAKYKWRLTTFVTENTAVYRDFVQTFIKNVNEITGGEVEIKGFGVGILANAFEGPKAVQNGVADIAFFYSAFLVNDNPANALFCGMPGGMSADPMFHWLYEGGGAQLWTDFRRQEMNLHSIVSGIGPTEVFLNSNKPIRTVADMKGVKIRTAGAWSDILVELGATPTVQQQTEVFTSLERGIIDATEFAGPSTNIKLGYHNVAKYILIPGIHSPSFAYEVIWKKDVWDKLPADLRMKLELAAKLTTMEGYLKTGMADLEAMEEYRKGKNEIVTLSPELIAEVRKLGRQWCERKSAEMKAKGNDWMEKISGSYYKFIDRWEEFGDYRLND